MLKYISISDFSLYFRTLPYQSFTLQINCRSCFSCHWSNFWFQLIFSMSVMWLKPPLLYEIWNKVQLSAGTRELLCDTPCSLEYCLYSSRVVNLNNFFCTGKVWPVHLRLAACCKLGWCLRFNNVLHPWALWVSGFSFFFLMLSPSPRLKPLQGESLHLLFSDFLSV